MGEPYTAYARRIAGKRWRGSVVFYNILGLEPLLTVSLLWWQNSCQLGRFWCFSMIWLSAHPSAGGASELLVVVITV